MSKNVSIVVVILVLVVIAGYLVWLRSRVAAPVSPQTSGEAVVESPTPQATVSASPSATPAEAEGAVKEKAATPASTKK